jgi:hypothetical protein
VQAAGVCHCLVERAHDGLDLRWREGFYDGLVRGQRVNGGF